MLQGNDILTWKVYNGDCMIDKLFDRRLHVLIVIVVLFALLLFKLADVTLIHGEMYREKSLNNRLRELPIIAKRGEVYDRNGNILAGNVTGFTVQFMDNKLGANELNTVAIQIFNLLADKKEDTIEFPIQKDMNGFYYTYDRNIDQWLANNGYETGLTAEAVFNKVRQNESIAEELDVYKAQQILLLKDIKLPISVRKMMFLQEMTKMDFLKSYGLGEELSAEDAFNKIKAIKSYRIEDTLNDEDVLKILTLRRGLKELGYYKYRPLKISNAVSKETAVLIQEMGMELPGVSISVDPIRNYPYKSTAAHILGYMGKIATEYELDKYVEENNYAKNDLIGKTGIEGKYELVLNGIDGTKNIEVDVYGILVREVEDGEYYVSKEGEDSLIKAEQSKAGKSIKLTLDIDLQEKVEGYLDYALSQIRVGGVYESKWGDYDYVRSFPNAKSAAAVVVNVKNGEVLALANYPSYDVNLFSAGISTKDWMSLQPENPRNPLEPRPLYSIATRTAVQPGSVYKPLSGIAAMDSGLDPNKRIYTNGYIELNNIRYGCWYWNDYGGRHGYQNMYEAIEHSCNYYFFGVASGYDYYRYKPLNYEMNISKFVSYATLFGLNEKTGLEIAEVSRGVPDTEKKMQIVKWGLKIALKNYMKHYFSEAVVNDDEQMKLIIDEIVSWSEENPSRGTIITRLIELGSNEDFYVTQSLADLIKYDYFNRMKWEQGDTLNLAIGQGDHSYTPVQMARYIMAIANDGYLYDLTLIKEVDGKPVERKEVSQIELSRDGIIADVREGMRRVNHGKAGSATKIFKDFPMVTAGKTGTAEKEGKIPPLDEITYLRDHFSEIAPYLEIIDVETRTNEIYIEREKEILKLQTEMAVVVSDEEKDKVMLKISSKLQSGYLNRGFVMREAIKEMSGDQLTDDDINAFRPEYDNFSWYVSFAPFDDPEIAVVVLIPQGGKGGYAAPIAREIIGEYFKLKSPTVSEDTITN